MANKEQLEILKQGVDVWNNWRKKHPEKLINLNESDLHGLNLLNVDFRGADLCMTDLKEANLSGADLFLAKLNSADLSGANLREVDLSKANLDMANLYRTNLEKADLSGVVLNNVNLISANLYRASLGGADLQRMNLRELNLRRTDLFWADLSGADLRGADLREANLGEANLHKANFCKCKIGWTVFGNVDLSTIKGLDEVIHYGPSTIGIDTIYKSKAKIPESFLRGAGTSDFFIKYITSLTNKSIKYYSCFISYSGRDQPFAERLFTDLQQKGVRCWFAPEHMKIGDKIRQTLDQSIRIHDKLLIVLSEHSINSEWVEKEVETAFEKERQHKKTVLFPIRLDNGVMKADQAWAADIRRTRHIGDFSKWKNHDLYQKAFERLLRDLKA